ncbi:MAG: hypothetical protein IJX90_00055 [Blautia sp.]|nr:hypothetical protein [Blautia sp.]
MKSMNVKSISGLLLSLCLAFAPAVPVAAEAAVQTNVEPAAEPATGDLPREPFAYEHDPRDLPKAMEDIIENPEAVYGFSPDPESDRLGDYAVYDWTDPVFVAQATKDRREYHESMETMMDILYTMRQVSACHF